MDQIHIEAVRGQRIADGLCILVAILWGTGFIASQNAIDAHMGPALIMAIRFLVGGVAMLPFCLRQPARIRGTDLRRGALAGVFLFLAFYAQTYGQARTTVSNTAFLTATNVVMIPFLAWIFSGKRPEGKTFVIAAATLAGIGILTLNPADILHFNGGDGVVLLCALLFACHIFYLGRAVEGANPSIINLVQLLTAAALSLLTLFLAERDSIRAADFSAGLGSVLYLGLVSTCLCFFLQTTAQKRTSQSRAGICLSTEGLFGSLFAVLLGMEPFTVRILAGGLIILGSVALLEVPFPAKLISPERRSDSNGR